MTYLTWAEVDLGAIQDNVRRLKALAGTRLMAVVKANAYGHGAAPVAQAAAAAGADWLGVARAEEGLALRAAGLTVPILVLGHTPPEMAAEAVGRGLALAVSDPDDARACAALGRSLGQPARLHLKVDTGMGRLGVAPEAAPALVEVLGALEGAQLEGLFTHFAGSDLRDLTSARRQTQRFEDVLAALQSTGRRPALVHASNSGAIFALPEARYDLVRSGIAVYGLDPSDEVPCPSGFVPALAWKARVMQVKTLPAGHGVSYGAEYVTPSEETVAVLPVGYADGYRRVPRNANEVLIRGRRAPVRGRVCMDQIVVGASHLPGLRAGEEAVLLGRQGEAEVSAGTLARRWGTINYDVTSGILARVPRVYR